MFEKHLKTERDTFAGFKIWLSLYRSILPTQVFHHTLLDYILHCKTQVYGHLSRLLLTYGNFRHFFEDLAIQAFSLGIGNLSVTGKYSQIEL